MSVPAIRSDRAATASAVSDKALEAILATAEPTRLKILFLIGPRGRMCVGDIAARFKISRPAISHHLKVLKTYGLVETEREGQEIYYSVRMEGLVGTLRSLADSLEACCGKGSTR
jgi:ArsR family transcriptional regulator, arsenate/arsenite/antimonite-responsive transcriptional repressor